MPPLPPFATDEPDTFYESSPLPTRRIRQQPPPDPNKRTSAYNVYDNYLDEGAADTQTNRQSGIGALGMGLLTMEDDDDDDDSDDEDDDARPRQPKSQQKPEAVSPQPQSLSPSKHAALAAATGVAAPKPPSPVQPVIAAPRPGYAAPIAALNLARPEATAAPKARQGPPGLSLQVQNPFQTPQERSHPQVPSTSPGLSSTPHPLHPPITPITPVFARPAKSPAIKFNNTVNRTSKPILRGNREETLLPKRGEKGDDFWRRFSMVAKEPAVAKESSWLRKTKKGSNALSRWVWIIGILLITAAAGAIGLGWYLSHKSPGHQQPKAIGGSANEIGSTTSIVLTSSPAGAAATGKTTSTKSSLHVSPTFTVARRDPEPSAFAVARGVAKMHQVHSGHGKRRIHWSLEP